MKVWHEVVSEHSMNLRMIGVFKEVQDADKAKEVIEKFTKYAKDKEGELNESTKRYDKTLIDLMEKYRVYSIGPNEMEQFIYNVSVEVDGSNVVITTDESEVSAFMKILIYKGAKVEVYSAHNYPETTEDNIRDKSSE